MAGLTEDGLDRTGCRYLGVLLNDFRGTARANAPVDTLQEPGGLGLVERVAAGQGAHREEPARSPPYRRWHPAGQSAGAVRPGCAGGRSRGGSPLAPEAHQLPSCGMGRVERVAVADDVVIEGQSKAATARRASASVGNNQWRVPLA